MTFIVLALPRSRTLWTSRFLSYGQWHCGHDEIQHARSLDDARDWFQQPDIGSVETAAAPFWRLLLKWHPEIRIATVRRPVEDVLASLEAAGLPATPERRARMEGLDRKLAQVERRIPGVLSVPFADLGTEAGCRRLFEHCLQAKHDHAWWTQWRRRHVSGDLKAQVRYWGVYGPKLEKLGRQAKQHTLAQMAARLPAPTAFAFQEEALDVWFRDAEPLVRAHMAASGQGIDDYGGKNVTALCHLDALGMLQIATARSNGRMFAYRMTVIAPSLDHEGKTIAEHLPIFADPACPGLGLKLQQWADAALAAKGVSAVDGRAGVAGDGPRMGTLYRRLGYREFGTLYRRDLTGGV